MTREEIIRMAREAGFGVSLPSVDYRGKIYGGDSTITDEMERFAALVAASEREACAKAAENEWNFDSTECGIDVANDIAAAIRARGGE